MGRKSNKELALQAEQREIESRQTLSELGDIISADQLTPALSRLYSELGMEGETDATVHIALCEADGKEARVWRGPPSDYDLERISRKFGSGDYRIKVYVKIPSGQTVIKGNQIITMRLSPEDEAVLRQQRESLTARPVFNAAPMTQQPLTAETIAQAIRLAMPPAPPVQPQMDVIGLVTGVAGLVKTMLPPPAPAANGINAIDVLRTVASVVKEMRPAGGDDDERGPRRGSNPNDIWVTLIDKFAPMFERVVANANPALAGNNVPPGATPANQPQLVEQPPMNVPPAPIVDTPEIQQLRMGMAFLIAQADGGHDPVAYADVVMDNMPEEAIDTLLDMADPVDYLATVDARVNQHRVWFLTLFETIRDAFVEVEEGEETSNATHEKAIDAFASVTKERPTS